MSASDDLVRDPLDPLYYAPKRVREAAQNASQEVKSQVPAAAGDDPSPAPTHATEPLDENGADENFRLPSFLEFSKSPGHRPEAA